MFGIHELRVPWCTRQLNVFNTLSIGQALKRRFSGFLANPSRNYSLVCWAGACSPGKPSAGTGSLGAEASNFAGIACSQLAGPVLTIRASGELGRRTQTMST